MKKILSIILVMFIFVGCAPKSQDGSVQSKAIVDQSGRQVTITQPVKRIVSCYYTITSTLIALGQKDKIVGLEEKADTRSLYQKAAPELLELPSVGSGKGINIETCKSLDPDIVILPDRLKDNISNLENLGLKVIIVSAENHEDFEGMIKIFSDMLGEQGNNTNKLLDFYQDRLEVIDKLNFENKPRVYIGGNSSNLTVATKDMVQTEMIGRAGGTSVSQDIEGNYWASVSSEQILVWNPDIILIPAGASYKEDIFKDDVVLKNVEAVKNNKIYSIPSKTLEGWDYPTPSWILGVLWTTNLLHPDLYDNQKLIEDIEDFYKTFYNIDVTGQDIMHETK